MFSVQNSAGGRFLPVICQQALVQLDIETPKGETLLQGSEFTVCNVHQSSSGSIQIYEPFGTDVLEQKLVALVTDAATSFPTIQWSPLRDSGSILRGVLRDFFPDAQFTDSIDVDPEEGWERPVLVVHTGIDDFDDQFEREQSFYAAVRADKALMRELQQTSVLFE